MLNKPAGTPAQCRAREEQRGRRDERFGELRRGAERAVEERGEAVDRRDVCEQHRNAADAEDDNQGDGEIAHDA